MHLVDDSIGQKIIQRGKEKRAMVLFVVGFEWFYIIGLNMGTLIRPWGGKKLIQLNKGRNDLYSHNLVWNKWEVPLNYEFCSNKNLLRQFLKAPEKLLWFSSSGWHWLWIPALESLKIPLCSLIPPSSHTVLEIFSFQRPIEYVCQGESFY